MDKNYIPVKYTGVKNTARLIKEIGVETVITELASYIEDDYKRWDQFDRSPRYASHTPDGVLELMPISDGEKFSFKYVNGHPKNFKDGLMTVVAFGVLSDVKTGYPQLLSEMTLGTALRTSATSALAAKYLAKENSRKMAIIGLGSQSEFQAYAFKALLGITDLQVFDIDNKAIEKFRKNLAGQNFRIKVASSAEAAVAGADIITTVTADKKQATILSDNMIGNGVHINGIGGDCPGKTELQKSIVARANVFVELEEQSRIEGEIQQMDKDFPVTEFWQVLKGDAPGRKSQDEITLFDSVGFALEDFSYLRFINDKIQNNEFADYYEEIDLITAPDDPRDLFSFLNC